MSTAVMMCGTVLVVGVFHLFNKRFILVVTHCITFVCAMFLVHFDWVSSEWAIPLTLGAIHAGSRIKSTIISGLNAEISTSEIRGFTFFLIQFIYEVAIVICTLVITFTYS
mmetsp:Transcript_102953/g.222277  ORF Transcript_102953/g.222277 Transcript_102953/m.222277 type:complete len:111 (+) Transcript_102953:64-396(+)